MSSTSPVISRTFDGTRGASASIIRRSISIAVTCAQRAARRSVRTPGPGPISRKRSSGCGPIRSTNRSAHAGSRKCCPYRFQARGSVILDGLAAPEFFLDLLDFLFAHAEVVSEFVDHRLGDAVANLVLGSARRFDRPLIDRNAIGQCVAVSP